MKKITKIVVTSLCMACSLTAGAMALADEENVIVHKSGNPLGPGVGIPKAPAVAPFSCTVDPEEGLLRVYFTGDLGQVVISVNEMATGVTTSMTVDSSEGIAQILLSGDPGFYAISFLLENGDIYEGTFML